MFYQPIQLNRSLNYQECKPSMVLIDKITCYWELKTVVSSLSYRIIPDGCIDLVINCGEENQFYVCPIMKESNFFHLNKNETWFGIRFYPGVLSSLLKIDVSELQFDTIELQLINAKLYQKLFLLFLKADTFEQKVNVLNAYLADRLQLNDHKVLEIIQTIYHTKGAILLKNYKSKNFALSERQIRRMFSKEIGLSPKKFANIVRGQSILQELKTNKHTKSYYDLYFDQSHMIREIKKLTGLTPKEIIRQFNL